MKIALLQCDTITELMRPHAGGDYPELFSRLLDQTQEDYQLDVFDATQGELPQNLADYTGFIITGSKHCVYQPAAWKLALEEFIRNANDGKHKLVGICFGHQILAKALGGQVQKSPRGCGIGIHTIGITKSATWMQPELTQCNLVFSHQDQVTSVPKNAEILATSPHCPIQMFIIGNNALGIQGHPEMNKSHSKALINQDIDNLGEDLAKRGHNSIEELSNDGSIVGHWIVNFLLL